MARTALCELGFSPQVFKKTKNRGSKGVDIALTKDMLSHAFRDNYDSAALVAGDGDYVPVVEEIKRIGKRVHVWFYRECISQELRESADQYYDVTSKFVDFWSEEIATELRRSERPIVNID